MSLFRRPSPRARLLGACAGVLALAALAGCPATVRPVPDPTKQGPPLDPPPQATAALTIHYGAHACAGGVLAPAQVMADERALATVLPASDAVVQAPLGPVRIVAGDVTTAVEVGADGTRVVLGCDDASFEGAALLPLTIVAPDARCSEVGALHVRAAGLERDLGLGERWTILVPRGGHIVRFARASEGAKEGERAVTTTLGDPPGRAPAALALAPDCVLRASGGVSAEDPATPP